jgi:hypothetical protein
MDEKILKLLYHSFDTLLTPEEQKILDQAVSQSEELKQEMEKIILIRKKVKANSVKTFKPFFADRVMQRIDRIKNRNYNDLLGESLFRIFKPVMIAAVLLILIITSYNMTSTKQLSLEGILAVPEVTLEQAFDPSLAYNMED